MNDVVRAISDSTRRDILRLVRGDELTAGQIAAQFSVTRPAISQHLKVLKDAGLIVERREGTRRLYQARREGLAELRAELEWMWDDGLTKLKELAEAEQRKPRRDDSSGDDRKGS